MTTITKDRLGHAGVGCLCLAAAVVNILVGGWPRYVLGATMLAFAVYDLYKAATIKETT